MKLLSTYLSYTIMLLGITTSLGVFLHDTNVDKMLISLATPYQFAEAEQAVVSHDSHRAKPDTHLHTHTDHAVFHQLVKENHNHPRTTPRGNDRKQLHHKRAGGSHEFDGNRLVIDPQTPSVL